jgi:hypothetical protein
MDVPYPGMDAACAANRNEDGTFLGLGIHCNGSRENSGTIERNHASERAALEVGLSDRIPATAKKLTAYSSLLITINHPMRIRKGAGPNASVREAWSQPGTGSKEAGLFSQVAR